MECEVIRDLLPSYLDGLCSLKSQELVEAHLASCPDCARAAEAMREAVRVEPQPDLRAKSPFYALRKPDSCGVFCRFPGLAGFCGERSAGPDGPQSGGPR